LTSTNIYIRQQQRCEDGAGTEPQFDRAGAARNNINFAGAKAGAEEQYQLLEL
jgi:hypothetical protein